MMDKNKPEPMVNMFIKILDKGFSISVPSSQERLYNDGIKAITARIEHHAQSHLPVEAVGLAALDCVVGLQRAQDQLKLLISALENQMDELDATLLKAL